MKNLLYSVFVSLFVLMGCQSEPRKITPEVPLVTAPMKIVAPKKVAADATTILSKKEVPILCYHNIKDFSSSASGMIKSYTVKPPAFAEQMKALADA
ncbi:MAG TPA: polysaccharide deacetylase family protein, partial [Flavobacterium sp.]|nr:polysaccharide deacetylase family protein [Flavobacterium sp.]